MDADQLEFLEPQAVTRRMFLPVAYGQSHTRRNRTIPTSHHSSCAWTALVWLNKSPRNIMGSYMIIGYTRKYELRRAVGDSHGGCGKWKQHGS
jgi:hypothetical protein